MTYDVAETEPKAVADELRDILTQEAAALTVADYDTLDGLAERKAAVMESFDPDALTVEDIEALRDMTLQNATLFEGTLSGLRNVIDRLQQVARASAHLDTYTANGAMQDLGPARSSFEKRS